LTAAVLWHQGNRFHPGGDNFGMASLFRPWLNRPVVRMKITDDYKAKYQLWASNPRVVAVPPPPRLPEFTSRKFSSHAEMNEWKRELIRELAHSAPAHE
jgi:hypothetical protein